MRRLIEDTARRCRSSGLKVPSRATVYKIIAAARAPKYRVADLPPPVRAALYYLDDASILPGPQLPFYCFNYGDRAALSFAAVLPWLALFQSGTPRGPRPSSRVLLPAVLRVRGIEDGRA